jgi:hypothetical protein
MKTNKIMIREKTDITVTPEKRVAGCFDLTPKKIGLQLQS